MGPFSAQTGHKFQYEDKSRCLEMKQTAEESSPAYYECVRVNAVLKGRKIVSIINKIEIIK